MLTMVLHFKDLINDHGVELREFNEDVIDAMGEASEELIC